MADPNLDPDVPPGLHLVSAFLAMEPADSLLSLARECGGGLITEKVQRFIWDFCITQATNQGNTNTPYLKNFVKKLILDNESRQRHDDDDSCVLDELYEQLGYYMTSIKEDDTSGQGSARVCKCISFLFPDADDGSQSCLKSRKLVVPLQCSLNMLEGDTGCSIWPSSLYLSEFVLSFPRTFSNKTCFEVGSGVGLVGICLSHVKASKVILSDGDLSTLANMKLNLELNELIPDSAMPERTVQNLNVVKCIHLPWESATRNLLKEFVPDIVLGADIIYDPSCLPNLVQVLSVLLHQTISHSQHACQNSLSDANSVDEGEVSDHLDKCNFKADQSSHEMADELADDNGSSNPATRKGRGPVAYIASVIRNIDTFNYFVQLAEQSNLSIIDITETQRPFDLLPYMHSYNRSSIRLFCVASNK